MIARPAQGQAFMEYGGVQAGAAGLGAGLAASHNNGAAVRNTYETAVQAQQALVQQNKAIEQYLAMGIKYEAKKDWDSAEKCFTYVLQVVNRRDGPGSANGIPALKHMVNIKVAQNKIDDAIGFQKTVVAFTQAAKNADPRNTLKTKMDLSNLFLKKDDYSSAEPYLQQSATLVEENKAFANEQKRSTLKTYTKVLRKLKKNAEADAVDSKLAKYETAESTASAANNTEIKPTTDALKSDSPAGATKASVEIK